MDDVLGFSGRNVVVTGAASGMGAATAQILIELGAEVTAIDIKPVELPVKDHFHLDLRDATAIDEVAASITGPVDAVFSCAGLPGPPFTDEDVMLVNFIGPRQLIESLVPKMPPGSAIAVIASMGGMGWQQQLPILLELARCDGFAATKAWCDDHPDAISASSYAFSKQAINAWVAWRSYGLITEKGIRLNCLNPGPTSTPMMPFFEQSMGKDFMDKFPKPIGRNSTAEEQAWPMIFLNSPRLSYLTGEALHVDGGFLAAMTTGQLEAAFLALSQ